jgi:hypothetical protein
MYKTGLARRIAGIKTNNPAACVSVQVIEVTPLLVVLLRL